MLSIVPGVATRLSISKYSVVYRVRTLKYQIVWHK